MSGADLIARRAKSVARGVGMFAGEMTAHSGSGAHLVDGDGREFIDLSTGIGVTTIGHCPPEVVDAIREQAGRLIHACIHVATYEPYVAVCEKLAELIPHGEATKVALFNSGAEAVENAVKIARQATGRGAVLCFEGAFHGRTLLALTLTAKSAYKHGCGPFAAEVYRLPYPNHYRHGHGLSLDAFVERELTRLRDGFVSGPIPASHVAAVIIEPILGEGGFVVAPPAYLRGLRQICDEHGIMLICDEVQSGLCRTGAWAGYSHAGIVPDLSTWAKSLGSGLPISAVMGKAAVMDAALPGTIGGTYGGNPLACAAALATLELMERERLADRARALGDKVRARFDDLKTRCTSVGDVRGVGAMIAIELSHDRRPERPAGELARAVTNRCRADGVLVLTAGAFGNILRILAPLVISDADLERALTVVENAILTATKESAE